MNTTTTINSVDKNDGGNQLGWSLFGLHIKIQRLHPTRCNIIFGVFMKEFPSTFCTQYLHSRLEFVWSMNAYFRHDHTLTNSAVCCTCTCLPIKCRRGLADRPDKKESVWRASSLDSKIWVSWVHTGGSCFPRE